MDSLAISLSCGQFQPNCDDPHVHLGYNPNHRRSKTSKDVKTEMVKASCKATGLSGRAQK